MFLSKTNKKNIESPEELIKKIKELEAEIKNINQRLEGLDNKNKASLQKIGMIRFNPFNEIGGDQSFSIAVLNEGNNGFVITSHYGREANRVYAKPVKNGLSDYSLSKEEKEAISRAIKI